MDEKRLQQLSRIAKELTELSSLSVVDGISYEHQSVQCLTDPLETVIGGNSEGLIGLATYLLELAINRTDYKHFQFDSSKIQDCVGSLVFQYEAAPWEKESL